MKEEEQLLKRLSDLDYLAEKRQMISYSDFLNSSEYSSYLAHKRDYQCKTVPFTKIAYLERQMIAFIPDALIFNEEFPIICFKIVPKNKKFAQEFNHRDILGSLMSLGIERKLLGDIFFQNGEGYFLTIEKIRDYILHEFHQIKRTEIVLEEVEILPDAFIPNFVYHRDTVSSNRLDCVVAQLCRCSRSVSAKKIGQGLVFVNSKEELNNSYTCKNGDIISVRGTGKFKIDQIDEVTKKGKLAIVYGQYS